MSIMTVSAVFKKDEELIARIQAIGMTHDDKQLYVEVRNGELGFHAWDGEIPEGIKEESEREGDALRYVQVQSDTEINAVVEDWMSQVMDNDEEPAVWFDSSRGWERSVIGRYLPWEVLFLDISMLYHLAEEKELDSHEEYLGVLSFFFNHPLWNAKVLKSTVKKLIDKIKNNKGAH